MGDEFAKDPGAEALAAINKVARAQGDPAYAFGGVSYRELIAALRGRLTECRKQVGRLEGLVDEVTRRRQSLEDLGFTMEELVAATTGMRIIMGAQHRLPSGHKLGNEELEEFIRQVLHEHRLDIRGRVLGERADRPETLREPGDETDGAQD